MKPLWTFHPELDFCELEDRILPAVANLGVIVLTTGGYVLTTPTPGIAAPTSFFMTGSGGISSMELGNNTGIPSLAATTSAGSGVSDTAAASIPLVTRNTIANDAPNAAPLIGRASGDRSPILPAGQIYRGGVPVTAPAESSKGMHGEQPSRSPRLGSVDSPPIRPGGAPLRILNDVTTNSTKTRADRIP